MQISPINSPLPDDATDFALGVQVDGIAWITNRVIVLYNGDCVVIPNGWEATQLDGIVMIYFEHSDSEVFNA